MKKKKRSLFLFFSMNNMIFEDNPNKTIKIYDTTLFDKMDVFKIEKVENIESDNEPQYEENLIKIQKEKSDFEYYISKIKNLISEIEANTINIKLEMETDKKRYKN